VKWDFLKIFTIWRGVFLLLAFVVLSLLMLNSNSQTEEQIKVVMTSKVLYPVQKVIQTFTKFENLQDENDRLLRENAQLRILNDQNRQAMIENRRFRNYLKFDQPLNYPVVYGEVIARDPSRLKSNLVINVGLNDSIETDMPVFTPRGVVGKVSKVMSNHSHVELLLDPSSKVSVMENRSRTIGILESDDSYGTFMRFPSHAEIFLGDTIITSGMGGLFPNGLAVGIVEKIDEDDVQVLSRASVKTFQNPNYIEEVFVLKKKSTRQLIYNGVTDVEN
jgi:rod shape-determining protein MreC